MPIHCCLLVLICFEQLSMKCILTWLLPELVWLEESAGKAHGLVDWIPSALAPVARWPTDTIERLWDQGVAKPSMK